VSQLFNQATSVAQTSNLPLHVPLHASTLLLGIAFAVIGGLIAGLFGAWRAARLSPAVALRDLG
jgi:ABC-type antimicrobial peptide transport system permease subunit